MFYCRMTHFDELLLTANPTLEQYDRFLLFITRLEFIFQRHIRNLYRLWEYLLFIACIVERKDKQCWIQKENVIVRVGDQESHWLSHIKHEWRVTKTQRASGRISRGTIKTLANMGSTREMELTWEDIAAAAAEHRQRWWCQPVGGPMLLQMSGLWN